MSILAPGPRPQFRSRFSDPNHPASSGDLLALVTAGKLSATSLKEKMPLSSGNIDVKHDSNGPPSFAPPNGVGRGGDWQYNQVHGYYGKTNTVVPSWGGRQAPLVYNHDNVAPIPYGGYNGNPNFMPPPYTNPSGPYVGAYQSNQNRQAYRKRESGDSDDEEQNHAKKEKVGGTRGVLRSVLKNNVLYMMIVNMPTEEEMKQAQLSLKEQQNTRRRE